jgi:hypothetical protein
MARLIGNTRRGINWLLWTTVAVVLAIFAGAAAWLSTYLGQLAH